MRIIVRALLDDRDMTQLELSRLTGIEKTRISSVLGGKMSFYLDETDRVAEALDVESSMLIGEPNVVRRELREAKRRSRPNS
jgi:transcriptional regulator with XRE-family HTH domain